MEKILVEPGEKKKLAAYFGVTQQTVRNALRGLTEGEQPDRIRAEAIRRGGAIVGRFVRLVPVSSNLEIRKEEKL